MDKKGGETIQMFDKHGINDLMEQAAQEVYENEIPHSIIKSDGISGINVLKKAMENSFFKEHELRFIINKNVHKHGKVTNQFFEFKKEVVLLNIWIREEDEEKKWELTYFSEGSPGKGWQHVDHLTGEFYIYQFHSGSREYFIFSQDKIDVGEFDIYGTLYNPTDNVDVGNTLKIKTKLPIIFVHTAKSREIKFHNNEEFFNFTKRLNLTQDRFFNYLFSHPDGNSYRHPEYFEKLVGSFLFSGKINNYPLHLFMIARQGSGKSTLEEAIDWKFEEDQEIVEGSGSTIKSLVPSFRSTTPQVGSLIQSNRLSIIDEFLRILVRIEADEREVQLAMLNPLLEHKKRVFSSGNGKLNGKMTAKMLAVSNGIFGCSNIHSLAKKIDNSFLSRLLIYYQDDEHIKSVEDSEKIEEINFKMDNKVFLAIYDYLNSFVVSFNKKKIDNLFKLYISDLQIDLYKEEDMGAEAIYTARYRHHFYLLLDGLVKIRCLCGNVGNFDVIDEDYKLLNEIIQRVVRNMIKKWRKR